MKVFIQFPINLLRMERRVPIFKFFVILWGLIALTITSLVHAESDRPSTLEWPLWLERSQLTEISQNNPLSKQASDFRGGSYELSTGELQTFDRWYRPAFQDLRVSWLLPLTPQVGLAWGVSTGERAEKYTIAPSLKLGFVMATPLSHRSRLSLSASTWLGGRMREKPCSAFYAKFGAVKAVNCRLAATILPPDETLDYLVFAIPQDRHLIKLKFEFNF